MVASTAAVPPLEELEPEGCYLGWEITLTTGKGADDLRDVFIFVEDRCELRVTELDAERERRAA